MTRVERRVTAKSYMTTHEGMRNRHAGMCIGGQHKHLNSKAAQQPSTAEMVHSTRRRKRVRMLVHSG